VAQPLTRAKAQNVSHRRKHFPPRIATCQFSSTAYTAKSPRHLLGDRSCRRFSCLRSAYEAIAQQSNDVFEEMRAAPLKIVVSR